MSIIIKKFLLIILTFAFCCPLFACSSIENIDKAAKNLTNYEMTIGYDHEGKTMQVSQKTEYKNNSEDILKKVKFHLYVTAFCAGAMNKPVSTTSQSKAYYNGINYAKFDLLSVKIANVDIAHYFEGNDNDILVVELSTALLPQKRIEIAFEYHISIPNLNHRFGWGENAVNVANFYPIACVYENGDFVCNGYHCNGDPFYSDMANYDVKINYPANLILASTGEQKTSSKDAIKTTHISAKTVRDFAFILSDKFEVAEQKWQDVKIKYYYYDDANYATNLKCAVDAIKTFSKLFCAYPYRTFSVVKTNFVHGGMEYPNLIYISDEVEADADYKNVIAHETAHQWWYNLVGSNAYDEPWLDESLTEFSTLIFYDYNKGYEYNHREMVEATYSNYVFFLSIYNDLLGTVDTSMTRAVNEYDTDPEYTYMAYVKGVLMYDSLYKIIGKRKFLKSLQMYAMDNCYKNVTQENLIASFEKASGANLKNFFDCWLEGKVIIN